MTNNTVQSSLGTGHTTPQTPYWLQWCTSQLPQISPFCGPIPKSNYLPHPCTRLTYHPKLHPYPISRFATVH